jgi:hypothetical protein
MPHHALSREQASVLSSKIDVILMTVTLRLLYLRDAQVSGVEQDRSRAIGCVVIEQLIM